MNFESKLPFKYFFGWSARIIVVLFSLLVARLINGIGHEFYASFIIVMALINLAPIFERGMGFYIQNRISLIKSRKIAGDIFFKKFKHWLYVSIFYILFAFVCIFLFHDYIGLMQSLQNVEILGYGGEILIAIGIFISFLLAGSNIIQKGMLGLGRDYIAISLQAIPYVVSGLSILLLIAFFDKLEAWVVPLYFLFFLLSLTAVVLVFLVRFSIESPQVGSNDESVDSSKFSHYTLLGVLILTSETVLAGVYLDSTDLANYGILLRVYLSILLITSVVNQINWSKYTETYFRSSNLAIINFLKSLAFQILIVCLFLTLVLSYRSYWMNFFHVESVLALEVHIFFSIGVLTRVVIENIATFYLATNRVLLMLVTTLFQFIFVILAILYFNDSLDIFYLSAIHMSSFVVTLLLAFIFSKTRLSKIYE
jgi:hypothetical protein